MISIKDACTIERVQKKKKHGIDNDVSKRVIRLGDGRSNGVANRCHKARTCLQGEEVIEGRCFVG